MIILANINQRYAAYIDKLPYTLLTNSNANLA